MLEVDGQQHYADSAGVPSARIYGETTRGDRDLRLSGYEVYRFSGFELSGKRVTGAVAEFFDCCHRRRQRPVLSHLEEGICSRALANNEFPEQSLTVSATLLKLAYGQ